VARLCDSLDRAAGVATSAAGRGDPPKGAEARTGRLAIVHRAVISSARRGHAHDDRGSRVSRLPRPVFHDAPVTRTSPPFARTAHHPVEGRVSGSSMVRGFCACP